MKYSFKNILKNSIVANIALAAIIALVLVYGTLKWLESYTHHNQGVVVPDVKGLKVEEAAAFLKNSGLRYNVIDSVYSKSVEPGSIVEVVPAVGAKVKEGRIVFITVNALTSQMAPIPDIEDISFRQSYAILKASGFESVEIEYVPGEFKDLVMDVTWQNRSLREGELVPLSAPLILKVSSGEAEILEEDSLNLPIQHLDSEDESWF